MRGQRSGNPDSSRTPRATASRIWETAMESRIARQEATASHKLSFFKNGRGTKTLVSSISRRFTLHSPPLCATM